jgi:hypothetical protein
MHTPHCGAAGIFHVLLVDRNPKGLHGARTGRRRSVMASFGRVMTFAGLAQYIGNDVMLQAIIHQHDMGIQKFVK